MTFSGGIGIGREFRTGATSIVHAEHLPYYLLQPGTTGDDCHMNESKRLEHAAGANPFPWSENDDNSDSPCGDNRGKPLTVTTL